MQSGRQCPPQHCLRWQRLQPSRYPQSSDQRAWLRDFRVRYAAVKASARGEDVVALLRDAEAAHAIAADIPTVQFLLAAAQAANAQPDAAFATLARMANGGLGSKHCRFAGVCLLAE